MPAAQDPVVMVVAVQSFSALVGKKGEHGEMIAVAGQTILPEGHPMVRQCPEYFAPMQASF